MSRTLSVSRLRRIPTLLLMLSFGACDADSPFGPDELETVVLGRVASVTSTAPESGGSVQSSGSESVAGIQVSVDGSPLTVTTDDNGDFRLEARSGDGRIRIRFRRGPIDVRLELRGVAPGSILQIELSLSEIGATVLSEINEDQREFEGIASLVALDGDTPSRTLRVSLAGANGPVMLQLLEGQTLFDNEGDIIVFEDLVAALSRGDLRVKIEGEGEVQHDGSVIAHSVKAETDEDDNVQPDALGNADFHGTASLISTEGDAPNRSLRVVLARLSGSTEVTLVEGVTLFDNEGDLTSFADVLAALEAGHPALRMEGVGRRSQDGSFIMASLVKAETDEFDDIGDQDRQQFRGSATLVSVEGLAPNRAARVNLSSAAGTVVIDLIEGVTIFDNEGDLTSFADALGALESQNPALRIEGEGRIGEDGVVKASRIKVETDA